MPPTAVFKWLKPSRPKSRPRSTSTPTPIKIPFFTIVRPPLNAAASQKQQGQRVIRGPGKFLCQTVRRTGSARSMGHREEFAVRWRLLDRARNFFSSFHGNRHQSCAAKAEAFPWSFQGFANKGRSTAVTRERAFPLH